MDRFMDRFVELGIPSFVNGMARGLVDPHGPHFLNRSRRHGLKHADNGRNINMDTKLQALLQPPSDITVTFLNLQKYLSPHYIKKDKVVAAPVVVAPVKKKRVVKKVTK